MDTSDVYPDLFGDALSYSSQRLAQLVSLVTAAATVEARRKAQRNAAKTIRSERALQELHDQERAAYQLARAGWAPAHDPRFLNQADLFQAARAWSAAAAYADADPDADAAARKCEERLRMLHPYAMAWYDRLRGEGAGALDAMREALPLFARASHARPGDPAAERRSLAAPDRLDAASWDGEPDDAEVALTGPDSGTGTQAEQRGHQIVRELQARALAERGYALTPDELVTTLGATTTLPSDVITRLARAASEDRVAWGAERSRADDLQQRLGRLLAPGHRARRVRRRRCAGPAGGGHGNRSRHWRPQRRAPCCREFPVHRRRRGHRSGYRRNPDGTSRHSYEHDPECPPSWPFCVRH